MSMGSPRTLSRKRRIRRKSQRRLWCCGLASLLALAVITGAHSPADQPRTPATPAQAGRQQAETWDEPLRLLDEARRAYKDVKDYSCTLIKREQVKGKVQPENVINMKIRKEPFSVMLSWQAPRDLAGQEAAYVAGQNKNMMRVNPKGVAGIFGWQNIAIDDPRVMEHSRHLITEAGIGNLIERFAKAYIADSKTKTVKVSLADYEYDKKQCIGIETIHSEARPGHGDYYRCLLYIDKKSHLPIRCECYDRPRAKGSDGDLIEMYSFANLKINPGYGDDTFKR
ncbi:MAG TPA: DUF1571 domain-containing protein [Gemmataceae bacterium]|nr:DUF1571 domain-containing protein [Gemmataceae bacterium]